jgi:hypothetical protein
MTRSPRYLALFAAFVSILLAFARTARADPAAQALFDDAKKLMQAGKYSDACPKFEESQRLAPGIGTQYNLASCYESLGKTASAWSLYLDVAGVAKSTNQPEREKAARQNAAALEPKLSRLNITVDKGAPADVEVKRDGVAIGRAQWGTAIPLDPGQHQETASAPGKKTFETSFLIEKGATTKSIAVPALEAGPPGPPPGYGPPAGYGPPSAYYGTTPPAAPKPTTRRRSGGMMAGGIVSICFGSLGVLVGGALLGACDLGSCNKAPGAGILVGGVVLVGGGIALTVVGSQKVPVEQKSAKTSLVPEIAIAPGSAELSWAF